MLHPPLTWEAWDPFSLFPKGSAEFLPLSGVCTLLRYHPGSFYKLGSTPRPQPWPVWKTETEQSRKPGTDVHLSPAVSRPSESEFWAERKDDESLTPALSAP